MSPASISGAMPEVMLGIRITLSETLVGPRLPSEPETSLGRFLMKRLGGGLPPMLVIAAAPSIPPEPASRRAIVSRRVSCFLASSLLRLPLPSYQVTISKLEHGCYSNIDEEGVER